MLARAKKPQGGDRMNASLERAGECCVYRFSAMASPCEVRIETDDMALAHRLGKIAEGEAIRVEQKFSRYRSDSVIAAINGAGGKEIAVDEETALLLNYAAECWRISDGMFDITSGVLRRIWRFDGSDRVPEKSAVEAVLPLIGWRKVHWRTPFIRLTTGMEVDFGGFGKEYAVDRSFELLRSEGAPPFLVNFGGDLRASGVRRGGARWRVAVESASTPGSREGVLEIGAQALTTSGDARRYLLKNGVRYSHILNPHTGWPVKNPPRSVTVAAATCTEAGLLSTMAMLHGEAAETFLKSEGVKAWVLR